MKMTGDLRVRTDKKYKDLYNDLKGLAFTEFHEIFFLCVCLGFKQHQRKDLGKTGDERFFSRTITPQEYSTYYALVMSENNMDFASIANDADVIRIMEEYANGGMDILINDFLNDYLREGLRIDRSSAKELPKEILHFIDEKIQSNRK